SNNLTARIIGGENAYIEDFPYQLSFERKEHHNCGAAIISTYFAISAAHCVYNKKLEELQFRSATSFREHGGYVHPVDYAKIHPKYNRGTHDFDLAVIKVKIAFAYGKEMQPVPLAMRAAQLQKLELPIVGHDLCKQAYTGDLTENMLCAGISGNQGTCFADSGGPLVVNGALVGVVSFGPDSCYEPKPNVFADVPAMLDFVLQNQQKINMSLALHSYSNNIFFNIFMRCVGASNNHTARIVGGQNANIEEFPYQLSFEKNGEHNCGASVIANYFAISAAHCVHNARVDELRFRSGATFSGHGGYLHPVDYYKIHPKYNVQNFDLSVIKVKIPFAYGKEIQPIPLANKNPPVGAVGVVTGYGLINVDGPVQAVQLQQLQISIVSTELCQQAYATNITENMICAGISGDEGTCYGDSGGPFVVNGALVGLVSFGQPDCDKPVAGVFADVPAMLDFVKEVTAKS
ncbi:hypothetical protein L9F63_011252, partial [Diploptera punctata]